ncbi:MAG: amino acid ABC transporter ATP-binding protein, partial [Treponema sp.]|nr:amino acid ABC transporter ATP-binding protein [Treponema sp.]
MGEEIIAVENISKSFDTTEVVKNVSFTVKRGEVLGIIGPSGSGKSTILRCITQLEKIDSGSIAVCGIPLVKNGVYGDKTALRKAALKVGLVFQNFNLFPHYSVLQNVMDAQVHVLKRSKEEARGP